MEAPAQNSYPMVNILAPNNKQNALHTSRNDINDENEIGKNHIFFLASPTHSLLKVKISAQRPKFFANKCLISIH